MKRLLSFLTAAVICAMCFSSCSGGKDDAGDTVGQGTTAEETKQEETTYKETHISRVETDPHDYTASSPYGICTWGDTVFYTEDSDFGKTIKYQNVKEPAEGGYTMYDETAAAEGKDPLSHMTDTSVIVDEKATAENGGAPVLLVATLYSEDHAVYGDDELVIASYNTLSGEWSEIKRDKFDEEYLTINSLVLYRDTIFYTTFDGNTDMDVTIHRIGRDGGGYASLTDTAASILLIHNDVIYYRGGGIYTCGLDFSGVAPFVSLEEDSMHVELILDADDKGVYCMARQEDGELRLCRFDPDDPSDYELVFDDYIYIILMRNGVAVYADLMEGYLTGVAYAYDASTEKSRQIYDFSDRADEIMINPLVCESGYIVCEISNLPSLDLSSDDWYSQYESYIACIDTETGAELSRLS